MARFVLDYIEDRVSSRFINVLVLIAAVGPLQHFIYIVQTQLTTHYPPLFYCLSWFIFPTLVCLLILVPLQIGNNDFIKTSTSLISIVSCLILFSYEAYACIVLIQFTSLPWFYFICLLASIICSIIAAFYYLYILIRKKSFTTYESQIGKQYTEIIAVDDEDNDNENEDDKENNAEDQRATLLSNDAQQQQPKNIEKVTYFTLLRQFIWPKLPLIKNKNANSVVFYPSRVIFTSFLSLAGVIGVNEMLIYYYTWSDEQLDALDGYITTLENIDFKLGRFDPQFTNLQETQQWSVNTAKAVYFFCRPISNALLFGSIIGLIVGLYGSVLILRSWKQKIICLRYNIDVNGNKLQNTMDLQRYPLKWSAKFISSTAASVVFGSAMFAILCAIIFGFAASIDFWNAFIESGVWRYIVCILVYYLLELIIFQFLCFGQWFKGAMDNKYVSLIIIINDLTYIPLAVIFCLIRIVQLIVICLISYLRPDLSIFPGSLATLDHGHLTFVASANLTVDKEKENVLESAESEVSGGNIEIHEIYSNKRMDMEEVNENET